MKDEVVIQKAFKVFYRGKIILPFLELIGRGSHDPGSFYHCKK